MLIRSLKTVLSKLACTARKPILDTWLLVFGARGCGWFFIQYERKNLFVVVITGLRQYYVRSFVKQSQYKKRSTI